MTRTPLLFLLLMLMGLIAHATLLFTDQFNYADGVNLGSGGPWAPGTSGAGNNATQIKVAAASAQISPDGFAAAAFNGIAVTPTTQSRTTAAQFNGATGISNSDGNVVYASFLLNIRDLPPANTRIAYLHDVTTSGGAAVEVWINDTGQIGLRKKNGTPVFATAVGTNITHLVVMRYAFQAGNDPVAMWIAPGSENYAADDEPDPTISITSVGSDNGSGGIKLFVIDSSSTTDCVYWIDEVRVGTTWAAVTPTGGPATPASSPVISQSLLSSQGIVLRGSNGPGSGNYQVLASTDVSQPVASWSSIATRPFDSAGNFDSTNSVAPGLPQQFFRLLVGGTIPPAPGAPVITNQPQSLTVIVGATTNLQVGATGDEPLAYFWSLNTNTHVGGNSPTLPLLNVQTADAGSYRVIVSNSVGSVTSTLATLTVLSSPVISAQPQTHGITVSNDTTFTVTATGVQPMSWQWFFNTNTPVGGNSNVFELLNAQFSDAGKYSVIITNSHGAITSSFAMLAVNPPVTELARFNLVGFGEGTTGGGMIAETDAAYRKVYTPLDLATAIRDANKTAGSVKVIEIMNDLNLGWNEIDPAVKSLSSTPFTQPATPLLHPVLLVTGVSTMQISPKSGLTIFSANGATIRRASWSIKNTANIIIRNLKFDELWEWDEQTKGDYDRNNWDMIVIGVGGGTVNHLWIDHCTFTKAYDGTIDTKGGAGRITYSWNKYEGDDGASNPNSFVWQQINVLEANLPAYPMYNFLRTRGFSAADIVAILQGSGKTHAIGELSLHPDNVNSCVTFHHQWYINPWDRLPRLAGGTVHNFNIYVDAPLMLAARRLRDAKVAVMSPADQTTFANNYNFRPSGNGSISTENGAMLVEKSVYIDCVWPLRNNQTNPNNPVYTGKILGLDTIYSFLESNGSTTYVRGNSTDPGNPLGPFQAPIIPFSWNTNAATPDGQLPYTYTMDDPADLQSIVTSPATGAGAGVLTWNKTNWLKTSY